MNHPLVNFLLVGAQKSGTTTLYSYLQEHPEIMMSSKKEVHFFNKDDYFKKEVPDYSYYHTFFGVPETGTYLYGEATPAYMYCRDAPKRIWQYNPDMKIILILRNPIERAFSHWNMEVSRGAESLSFIEALRKESERSREALPSQHYVYSYMDRGYYSCQIRELWRFFKQEHTLVLKYDELKDNPSSVLVKLFDFLGVDRSYAKTLTYEKKILHKASYKTNMSEEERTLLQECYEHEIFQLEFLLGMECSDWLA